MNVRKYITSVYTNKWMCIKKNYNTFPYLFKLKPSPLNSLIILIN